MSNSATAIIAANYGPKLIRFLLNSFKVKAWPKEVQTRLRALSIPRYYWQIQGWVTLGTIILVAYFPFKLAAIFTNLQESILKKEAFIFVSEARYGVIVLGLFLGCFLVMGTILAIEWLLSNSRSRKYLISTWVINHFPFHPFQVSLVFLKISCLLIVMFIPLFIYIFNSYIAISDAQMIVSMGFNRKKNYLYADISKVEVSIVRKKEYNNSLAEIVATTSDGMHYKLLPSNDITQMDPDSINAFFQRLKEMSVPLIITKISKEEFVDLGLCLEENKRSYSALFNVDYDDVQGNNCFVGVKVEGFPFKFN